MTLGTSVPGAGTWGGFTPAFLPMGNEGDSLGHDVRI